MKNVIIYLTLIVSLLACSNKKTKNMDEITAKNIVEKITAQIKHYPKEPMYYVYAGNSLCVYELLVNDLPVHQNYEYTQQGTPIYINDAILKSGKQKISFRLYPAPKEYNGGKEVFDPETTLDVKVYQQDLAKKDINTQQEVKIVNLPTKIRMVGGDNDIPMDEFVGKGLKYYEHIFNFDAEVPYNNEGWSTGQDLTKLNQKELEKAVVNFYMSRKEIVLQKDMDAFARQVFVGLKDQLAVEYRDKKYVEDAWNEWIVAYNNPTYKFQPFENYKMVLFGDGKIVCLRLNSNDVRLREHSALWGKYKDADGTVGDFHKLYLYLPQGKKISELEMIR